jgi:hypothetical protein
MTENKQPAPPIITPDMTVLDVVSKYRTTEHVFKMYEQQAGECICCNALFDRLDQMAERYSIDLNELLMDLTTKINKSSDG